MTQILVGLITEWMSMYLLLLSPKRTQTLYPPTHHQTYTILNQNTSHTSVTNNVLQKCLTVEQLLRIAYTLYIPYRVIYQITWNIWRPQSLTIKNKPQFVIRHGLKMTNLKRTSPTTVDKSFRLLIQLSKFKNAAP